VRREAASRAFMAFVMCGASSSTRSRTAAAVVLVLFVMRLTVEGHWPTGKVHYCA
jgi:hypothetical protein